jgi:hypothetical protein
VKEFENLRINTFDNNKDNFGNIIITDIDDCECEDDDDDEANKKKK